MHLLWKIAITAFFIPVPIVKSMPHREKAEMQPLPIKYAIQHFEAELKPYFQS
jgi:hypothetical protein